MTGPGVFIEEAQSWPSIVQLPTSVPAFLGCTPNGPDGVPHVHQLRTMSDFERICGTGVAPWQYRLLDMLQLYFLNGGRRCFVVSVGNHDRPVTKADFEAGLAALAKEDEPTLILLGEAVNLPAADYYDLARQALVQCADRRDRFAILDVIDGVDEFRDSIGDQNLMWGAAYHPFLQALGQQGALPPSPAVGGVYVFVDTTRGVWVPPAGVDFVGVGAPAIAIDDAAQASLNVHDSGKSINVIRAIRGRGTVVWGTRTLAGNDPEWRYVQARRLMASIEKSIVRSTAFVTFEPNTEATWHRIAVMIEYYLNSLWRQGAMPGQSAAQAYFVQVGLGSTMTAQDVLEGRLMILIGVALTRPAQFSIVRITHTMQH